jgi:D-beta-D-heptose 7-phosphate kinase/D-beta-D-heptose 1-phosphate adenosyltransferase
VGLNSDASVQRLKGLTRPINNTESRAIVISNLAIVDLVVVFEEDTPLELIKTLLPDVLVKGVIIPLIK